MAVDETDDAIGVPEWVVTFGDMMSLLLTFFIMLVSMSEMKEDEKYQALVDSIRQRFGYEGAMVSLAPGQMRPRNSTFQHLATLGRARRANTMNGGDKVKAPTGDNPRVRTIRQGHQPTVGGVIYFDEGKAELTEENKKQLQIVAQVVGGKSQKIEIRGHTSRKPVDPKSGHHDRWDLAFERCRNVMRELIGLGIDPHRFRLAIAGDNEPVHLGIDPKERRKNSRVEVVMLNETVQDLEGTPEERESIYSRD
ncbi:MAG: flagellar motor protein MotB [Pirellulales bacterium]